MRARELGVAVLTPWYPVRARPFQGAFVQAMVEATAPGCDLTVYHGSEWVAPLTSAEQAAIDGSLARLLPTALIRSRTVAGAGLVTVPVPLRPQPPWAEIAERHEVALRAALAGRSLPARVVHAHVGLPSGWAAVRNADPRARVFVTEHASFLPTLLAEPESRDRYDQVLHRCTALLAVSEAVRAPLVAAFPHHADRIGVIANPVAFGPPRPTAVTGLRRWLYVGGLTPGKGVARLVEAFAACRAEDPSLTLTVVGDGVLSGALKDRVGALGIAGAVSFTGAVPHGTALRLMREHDVLVHPSRSETFGVVVVEAVAAGLPVLVTRCGGPQETLKGIESAAGEFVPVEESADALVEGYWRLRDRFPAGLDLPHARQRLFERYSYQAVAQAYHRMWFPGEDDAAPSGPAVPAGPAAPDAGRWRGVRVLFLALGATRARVVAAESADVATGGGRAVVLVADKAAWRGHRFADGVQVAEFSPLSAVRAPGPLAWPLVVRGPRAVFAALRRGPLARPVARVERAYWSRLGRWARRGRWPLAGGAPGDDRKARDLQHLLIGHRLLGGSPVDLVVVADPGSMPLAAELLAARLPMLSASRMCYSVDAVPDRLGAPAAGYPRARQS